MKRIIFLCILALSFGFSLFAQKMWEGTGVAGRYGDFPYTGFYGASNIFPRNSMVNVQNISNGKVVQIIISGGLEDPALFLLLSRQAADVLEMDKSDIAQVRVSLAAQAADPLVPAYADLPFSDDPEVNPASRAGDVNSAVDKTVASPAASAASGPAAGKAVPGPAVTGPAVPGKEQPKEAAATGAREEAPAISSSVPASGPTAELPMEKPVPARRSPSISDTWIIGDTPGSVAPEAGAPIAKALPVPKDTGERKPADTETVVSLEPANPRPPTGEASSKALDSIIASIPGTEADREWAGKNLPLVKDLPARSYYLQVAASMNPAQVKPVVDTLVKAYPKHPVVVKSASGDDPYYRVMVGPLNEDERGLALRQVRAKGFKDAFLRQNK